MINVDGNIILVDVAFSNDDIVVQFIMFCNFLVCFRNFSFCFLRVRV
jgi:hypothetical protein